MAKNYRASLRKSGASGKKKHRRVPHRRVLLPFVTTRVRRCQRALSRAILLPSRHGLSSPYMTYLLRTRVPMAGIAQRLCSRFGHFLALTVPSAVGFAPCSFYAAPWRILAFTTRSHTTSQNSNYAILPNYGRILSQSIVLCERIRKPSIHAGLRTFIFKIAGSGNAY